MDTILRLPRIKTIYKRFRLRPATVVGQDRVRAILAQYGLEALAPPEHPDVLGRSGSLVVQTRLGKAILKGYKQSVDLPSVIHEHSILTYLAQIDFPVPRLFVAQSGETFVQVDGTTYVLFGFVEGDTRYPQHLLLPAQRQKLVATAGKTLSTLHRDLKDFVPKGRNPNGFKSRSEGRWRDLPWYMEKLDRCMAEAPALSGKGGEAGELHAELLQRAGWLHDRLDALDKSLEAAALPRLIIHGDYRPSNLLFRRGEPPVVLDFELARLEWRATDLARAGKVFARKRSMGLCFDRFKSFMDAYQAGCPVAEEELKLVPNVWQFLLIRRLMVCWYELCDAPNKEREAEIRDHLVWLDWLLAHEADLQAHLAPLESPTSGQKAKGD